ncbi:hypothetical protein H0H92_000984, partial [Tricholoma furcatifolium]
MTSYNLRRRNNTGEALSNVAASAARSGEQSPSQEPFSRSWSDVVANRSPSPPQGQEMYPDVRASADAAIERSLDNPDRGTVSESDSKASRKSSEERDENPNPWVK